LNELEKKRKLLYISFLWILFLFNLLFLPFKRFQAWIFFSTEFFLASNYWKKMVKN
jgi:hypothetical protein